MDYSVLKKLFLFEIVLLFIQFWMGMSTNLFVNIPVSSFNFFGYSDGWLVLAHIVNGSLVLAVSGAILFYSYQTKMGFIRSLSILTILFVVSALVNGVVFLKGFSTPSLYNVENDFSMAMAMSFLFAFTVLFSEVYTIVRTEKIN